MDTTKVDDLSQPGRTGQRHDRFEGVVNFRDLGGYQVASGGQTKWGVLFRSDALHRLTTADLVAYERLGIRTVYDLRSEGERTLRPNPMTSRSVELERFVPRDEFDDGSFLKTAADAERRLCDVYLAILATAGPLFGELFSGLVEPGVLPALFHCAGGKDRTGLAAALLMTWLGVDSVAVLDDYELTTACQTAERHQEILEWFVTRGMAVEAANAFLGTPRWVMAEALAVLDGTYGGIERYLRGAGALSAETLSALRRNLISPA
jgi:protein-tyrosine phosphatase